MGKVGLVYISHYPARMHDSGTFRSVYPGMRLIRTYQGWRFVRRWPFIVPSVVQVYELDITSEEQWNEMARSN